MKWSFLVVFVLSPSFVVGDILGKRWYEGAVGRGGREVVVEGEGVEEEDDEVTLLLTWRMRWQDM